MRMSLPSPTTCSITRAPSARSMTARGNGASNGGGIVWLTTKVCTTPRRARDGAIGVDHDAGGATAAEADDGHGPGGVERAERAQERRGRPRVADGRVHARRRGRATSELARGGGA